MKMTFSVETKPECIDYLKLAYKGELYRLEQFVNKFENKDFQLGEELKTCNMIYRGENLEYNTYTSLRVALSDKLKVSRLYSDEVYSQELHLSICNFNYYKAAKFLEKAEECLQTARYYLMEAANIIEHNEKIPWKYGYQPIFDVRTMNFSTAIVWYNNCFDYVLQIAFLAFELYSFSSKYKENMSFEECLRLCTFKLFKDMHNSRSKNENYDILWGILNTCHDAVSDVNTWANYAKHKGGIGYIGLKPDSPFQVYVQSPGGGEVESRTDEFEPIKLDIDQSLDTMIKAHEALYVCINKLVEFIDFSAAHFSIDDNGKFVIPEPATYVKQLFK